LPIEKGSAMNFYDDPENVKKYIEMHGDYDGNNIYQLLSQLLSMNSTPLELASGAGLDIEYLKKKYSVKGSGLSDEFLKVCKEMHPEISFLKLNAQTLEVKDKFDCIYSNKVLHHLTQDALKESFQ
jgi:trans-aconitate methyltransferase